MLGAGPETSQVLVDFDREAILTIVHLRGLSFDGCGVLFDGFAVQDGTVVVDLFTPGGAQVCDAIDHSPSVFAVALDRDVTGPPPFDVAIRAGPGRAPAPHPPLAADVFATTTTVPPEPEPISTTSPPTVPPTAPPLGVTGAAGQRSPPAFAQRVAEPGGAFDLPLLVGWESDGPAPGSAAVRITGRGALEVRTYQPDDDAWKAAVGNDRDLAVVPGPIAVAMPVYEQGSDGLVTTGEVVTAQEYRYASKTSFLQVAVRGWERDGHVVVARLGYPDPARVSESLTGLTPNALLDDLRILR